VSSGGTLLKFAEKLKVPFLRVPGGMAPRASLPYLFVPLLLSLEKMKLVSRASKELSETIEVLAKVSAENAPEKPAKDNFAKTLALNLRQSMPVVYGFGVYRGVAMRWKQQFNENSKVPAKWEVFSELDHNEVAGWENAGALAENCAAVFLRDKTEPVEIRSRIEITKKLMKPAVSKTFEVWAQGKSDLARMLSAVCVGDFTSVYLSLLRGVDPTPVKTINLLKQQLEQNRTKEKIVRELEKIAVD
jgi:glucose/mannose-6-phosphate isomerase